MFGQSMFLQCRLSTAELHFLALLAMHLSALCHRCLYDSFGEQLALSFKNRVSEFHDGDFGVHIIVVYWSLYFLCMHP